jgi:hypothetical protein
MELSGGMRDAEALGQLLQRGPQTTQHVETRRSALALAGVRPMWSIRRPPRCRVRRKPSEANPSETRRIGVPFEPAASSRRTPRT